MADMIKALQMLKEGCEEIAICNKCPIKIFCSKEFLNHGPGEWGNNIPEVEEEPEEEETSIMVMRERLDKLLDMVDTITSHFGDCGSCPLTKKIDCNGNNCQQKLLAWLQDQPIL